MSTDNATDRQEPAPLLGVGSSEGLGITDYEKKAAIRYLWLRDPSRIKHDPDGHLIVGQAGGEDVLWGKALDAVIDAAMQADHDALRDSMKAATRPDPRIAFEVWWGGKDVERTAAWLDQSPKQVALSAWLASATIHGA